MRARPIQPLLCSTRNWESGLVPEPDATGALYLSHFQLWNRAGLTKSRFLLARLHMPSLKDKFTARKAREALARLPKGSGSTASKIAYDDTIKRIREQEKGFSDLAIVTLS